jgi:hypothetical protein
MSWIFRGDRIQQNFFWQTAACRCGSSTAFQGTLKIGKESSVPETLENFHI